MKPRWLLAALAALMLAPPLTAGERKDDRQSTAKAELKTYQVPFKLTETQHVLVRCKINGKGPYNFIVDTGAPGLYISVEAAKKMGLEFDGKKPVFVVKRFEIEGGPVQTDIKAFIETPFQLKGMNAMGMPGHELHGILGYALLAHYKIEYDFTRDRLAWTRLDFKPPPPVPLGVKPDQGVQDMEKLGGLMEAFAILMGKRTPPTPVQRGFFGMELQEKDGGVVVKSVLKGSPAAKAGLKAGDRLTQISNKDVSTAAEALRQVAEVTPGRTVQLTIRRDGNTSNLKITAGEGL